MYPNIGVFTNSFNLFELGQW